MDCQNHFCIYHKDRKCTLEEIELDINGTCKACIYPNILPQVLENAKKDLLQKYGENK